jgi:hypothetical protein
MVIRPIFGKAGPLKQKITDELWDKDIATVG